MVRGFLFFIFLFVGCQPSQPDIEALKAKNYPVYLDLERVSADPSLPSVAVKITRLERYFDSIKVHLRGNTLADTLAVYRRYFSEATPLLSAWLFRLKNVPDTILAQMVVAFAVDSLTLAFIDTIYRYYPPDYPFDKLFLRPLQRFKHYFPSFTLPKIFTFYPGYDYQRPVYFQLDDQVFVYESYVGIGLHYFLGVDAPFYHPELPRYMRRRCRIESLLPRVFHKVLEQYQPRLTPAHFPTLLQEMIHVGIRYYCLDKLLEEVPDSELIYYTSAQWQWAQKFEARIYKMLLPYLFSKDYNQYKEFIAEGPFTKRLGAHSAPRLGHFIGWRIVQSYMEGHPEVSLDSLLTMPIAQYEQLFREAKYKP